ncbi:GntR family transcriptional regulator [Cohnella herbarum]|uniref:GntR family transcriptional regulator n=1 Tax=Cohnella herbarum TaxID=2728023 RepID=A0A7Z2ZNW8_9BACL|nr:GntR family transcriptional regulator [Cohnella herbarum]QJD85462.1 GntR family transcriptional regulator [Cohnella herbarum]
MSSSSLETTAYREIRERIMQAQYMPGTMLSENELAGTLGMSRTPVRAAISLLEREGLVESFKGRGVMVKDISFHDFSEMYEVLISMQLFVFDAALKRKIGFDLETMKQLLDKQKEALERDDYYGYYVHSLLFTESILRTTRNENMLRIVELYRGKYVFRMVSYRKKYPQYKPSYSALTNERVYKALALGDVAGAKAAIIEQYSTTHEQLMLDGIIR